LDVIFVNALRTLGTYNRKNIIYLFLRAKLKNGIGNTIENEKMNGKEVVQQQLLRQRAPPHLTKTNHPMTTAAITTPITISVVAMLSDIENIKN